jgi:NitT/TauT family transport system permease protein
MATSTSSANPGRTRASGPVRWLTEPVVSVPVVLVLVILFWHWSIRFFGVPELLMPTPLAVAKTFWADTASGLYWTHMGATLTETFFGFVFGTLAGVVVAAILVQSSFLERTFYPFLVAFQTFPKVAIAPLLITWFGFGIAPKAILGGLLSFFPVLVNMMIGLRSVPSEQLELLQSLQASRWQVFRIAQLPASLSYFFAAVETGIVLTILGVITGEFVGARKGLGYLVVQKNAIMSIDGVFAVLILMGLLGVGFHLLAKTAHKRIIFWK